MEDVKALVDAGKFDEAVDRARGMLKYDDQYANALRFQLARNPLGGEALTRRLIKEAQEPQGSIYSEEGRIEELHDVFRLGSRDGVLSPAQQKQVEPYLAQLYKTIPEIRAKIGETDRAHAAEEEAKEKEARALSEAVARAAREEMERLMAAQRRAIWRCNGSTACDKAFAIAQIFVDQHADMKIQVATNTIVETYTPTDSGKLGLKIIKLPLQGDEAEIRLTAACKRGTDSDGVCYTRELATYEAFPVFMSANFRG